MSWHTLTRVQKDEANRKNRLRYAQSETYRHKFRLYARNYRKSEQGRIAARIRNAIYSYRGRWKLYGKPVKLHWDFMRHVTGLTQEQFQERFGKAQQVDHIVPLIRFDLTNPEHVVRACWIGNLQATTRLKNQKKGDMAPDGLDIMQLPWAENRDAITEALHLIITLLRNEKDY